MDELGYGFDGLIEGQDVRYKEQLSLSKEDKIYLHNTDFGSKYLKKVSREVFCNLLNIERKIDEARNTLKLAQKEQIIELNKLKDE